MENKIKDLLEFQRTATEEIRYVLNNSIDKEYNSVKFKILEEELQLRNGFISDLENLL